MVQWYWLLAKNTYNLTNNIGLPILLTGAVFRMVFRSGPRETLFSVEKLSHIMTNLEDEDPRFVCCLNIN